MKLLILVLALNLSNNYTENNILNISSKNFTPQQNAVRAFLIYQGSFIEGSINLQRTQYGIRPSNYSFSGIANRQSAGQFYPDSQFTQLNSNNQYAIKYNFTHTISVPGLGTAYVTL